MIILIDNINVFNKYINIYLININIYYHKVVIININKNLILLLNKI